MSTTSLEQTTTAADGGLGSGDPPPADTKQSGTGDRLYRVVWRWHFYAGMIIAPALIVVAATGALYIFKDELEAVLHPGVTYVEPAAERATYEQQLAAARAAVPPTYRIGLMQVFTNPKRATSLAMAGEKFQYGYVDPYRGHYLGAIETGRLFRRRAQAAPELVPGHHGPDRRRADHLLDDRARGDGNLSVVAAQSEPAVGRVAAAVAAEALCGAARPALGGWHLRGDRRDRDLADRPDLHVRLGQRFSIRCAEDRCLRHVFKTDAVQVPARGQGRAHRPDHRDCAAEECPATT